MKYFFLLLLILALGCKETEDIGNQLSDADILYLQNQARNKCLRDTEGKYDDFDATSSRQYVPNESNELTRRRTWKLKYTGNLTVTAYIAVWKLDLTTDTVYLLWTDTTLNSVTPKYKFIKMPLTTNSELIEKLQAIECDDSKTDHTSYSASSSTFKSSYDFTSAFSGSPRTKTQSTVKYEFRAKELALFGQFHSSTVTKKYDANSTVTDTDTRTIELTLMATDATDLPTLNASYLTYPDAQREYCMLAFTAGSPNVYTYPFSNLDCTDNELGPDPDDDADSDFAATELVL